jgi:hypothetical protein
MHAALVYTMPMKKVFFIFFASCLFFLSHEDASAASFAIPKTGTSSPAVVSLKKAPGFVANQLYLQNFVKKLERVNKNNPNLAAIVEQVKLDAATTTDLKGLFLKQAKMTVKKNKISSGDFLKDRFAGFFEFLMPKKALAIGALPFGGPLLFTYYCTCSQTWLVYIGPTSNLATSNMLLDYVTGSQGFENYNLPFTTWVMGLEIPSVPLCYVYAGYTCFTITAEGMITPIVGTSAI